MKLKNSTLARFFSRTLSRIVFGLGLALILAYWISVKPVGLRTGYAEDLCFTDLSRQLMSEQIQEYGRPWFWTDKVMAPMGASIPYMSWSPERDWLGSLFWNWDPNFPFSWFYAGFSWVVSFLAVGFILKKMNLGATTAWSMALAVVLFHVPRHFKIWHHFEHLLQHWIYFSFFMDAWIWQRFHREKVWDWRLEAWRGLIGIGMIQGVGTFWGPLLLEWVLVRLAILILWLQRRNRGEKIEVSCLKEKWKQVVAPVFLGSVLLALDLRWYPPLIEEVRKLTSVYQDSGWFANIGYFFRPLWVEPLGWHPFSRIDHPETVVSVGWFYWIPALFALNVVRKRKGGAGLVTVMPFLVLLVIAVLYASINEDTHFFQVAVQKVIPFMSYFRVSSRWGLFLPQILAVLIVLAWPDLKRRWKAKMDSRFKKIWIGALCVFAGLSCLEFSWLLYPVNMMPPIPSAMASLLQEVKESPGTTVLDLPFCVAGGNGFCTAEQCPQYPASTLSECMRIWHGKKVYGLYQPRMTSAHCQLYRQPPYRNWFSAWRENRCFSGEEWQDFCGYLDQHPELSAVMVYADIWSAAGTPDCMAEFQKHLGSPLREASVMTAPTRGGEGANPTRVFRFKTRCESSRSTQSESKTD